MVSVALERRTSYKIPVDRPRILIHVVKAVVDVQVCVVVSRNAVRVLFIVVLDNALLAQYDGLLLLDVALEAHQHINMTAYLHQPGPYASQVRYVVVPLEVLDVKIVHIHDVGHRYLKRKHRVNQARLIA